MSLWTRGGLTWKELGRRLLHQIYEDEVLGRCAELAYFFLFSIFPLLLFLTTLLGVLTRVSFELRASLFAYVSRVSPSQEITDLLTGTLDEIAAGSGGTKLWVSLLTAVWMSSNGMLAVSRALNVACGLKETRRIWKRRVIAVVLTAVFAVLVVSALAIIFYGEAIAEALAARVGIAAAFAVLWRLLQWPLVLVFLFLSVEMVYNYAPNLGPTPHRQWGTPGAVTAVALWLAASIGLRVYLSYFHVYTKAYGSLGAVILLLVWFYLTGFAILMGGEVNSEIAQARAEQAKAQGINVPAVKEAKRRARRRWLWMRARRGE